MKHNNKVKAIYRIVLTITICLSSIFAKAQTTDSVRLAINNILAPLNKTLIPTGILAENSYPLRLCSWHTKQQEQITTKTPPLFMAHETIGESNN